MYDIPIRKMFRLLYLVLFVVFILIALWLDVIDILFEECPYKKWKRGEQDIIESDVEIIVDGLSRVCIAEGKEHSGDGKQNAFIAKVKNHLTNSDIVPSAVNEK